MRAESDQPAAGSSPAASAGGAVAVLAAAAAFGSTGTAAHFAPAGASSASIGAARIAVGGVLLLALAVRTADGRRAARALLSAGVRRLARSHWPRPRWLVISCASSPRSG